MATVSSRTGQAALQSLPSKSSTSKRSIQNYALPDSLIHDRSSLGEGLTVLKVCKNGRLQTRRIAFTPDRRNLLVTTSRLKGIKGFLQKPRSGDASVKRISLASFDRIQRGSSSKRFLVARREAVEGSSEEVLKLLDSDTACLSVVYTKHENGNDTLDTLDLIVANAADYEVLLTVLENLHALHLEECQRQTGDIQLLHYYWVTMGKEWQSDMGLHEFLSLCEKLQVSIKRAGLICMFKEECTKYGREEEQLLTFSAIANLLDHVRRLSVSPGKNPFEDLWAELVETDPVPPVGWQGEEGAPVELNISRDDSISIVAFLSFLRSQQKEYSTSLEEATDLVHILNQQACGYDLKGQVCADDSLLESRVEEKQMDRLSKSRFLAFLTSDANDLLHPARGKMGSDDMNHPLSHYWINTSHDTYLSTVGHSFHGKSAYAKIRGGHTATDEQSYMSALLRGARCLEIDVWDSPDEREPVISKHQPKPNDKCMSLQVVLRSIREFLNQQPYSFPIILKMENHCSPKVQLTIAKRLHEFLGSANLLVRPQNEKLDADITLPSPEQTRGKVIIIAKRPKVIRPGRMVKLDDFDADNDVYHAPAAKESSFDRKQISMIDGEEEKEEMDTRPIVGFDERGPIRSEFYDGLVESPEQLLEIANQEAAETQKEAQGAAFLAKEMKREAEQSEKRAASLTHHSGLTPQEVKRRAAKALGTTSSEDDSDEVQIRGEEKSSKEEGLEVYDVLPDFVEGSRSLYEQAAKEATESAGHEAQCHMALRDKEEAYRMAKANLDMSRQREKTVFENAKRAAVEARSNREYAESAKERVEKVRELLRSSKDQSSSAGNVVQTALTEAKISEKRAADAEARAARAAKAAENDRVRADDETKREETLEQEVNELHNECIKATEAAKAARGRLEKARAMLDRVNEQLKLIERSSQFRREMQTQSASEGHPMNHAKGSFIEKHDAKLEEKRKCKELIKESSDESSNAEGFRIRMQKTFEEKTYLWKMQVEVAAKARKTADRSSHLAEELAEDAAEEREAANLRHIARQRAEATVENKDSYRSSIEAQLAEAERAAKEAEEIAVRSRKKAAHLEKEAEKVKDHSRFESAVERADLERREAQNQYEQARHDREGKDKIMIEEKRRLDTTSEVYQAAARNVALEIDRAKVEHIYQQEAVVAYNEALAARQRATESAQAFEAATYNAEVKRLAAKRALEYKQMMDMMVEIPNDLARMTMLHSSKYHNWKKSLALSNSHMHSISHNVLLLKVDKDPDHEANNLQLFTKTHLCRVYPSWREVQKKACSNYDPVFAWALGCQLVSSNFHSPDESLLIAEGRFRQNGSCGYVLKPPYLIDNMSQAEYEQKWTFSILGGFNLPKSIRKTAGTVNPLVKVSMYSGSAREMRISYRTRPCHHNGLNPVWTSHNKFTFVVPNPSVSMLSFSVWHANDDGSESFIAAAALPAVCVREGYRYVALFDANHSRSGAFASAGLLVRATRR